MHDRDLEEQLVPKLVRIHGERVDPNTLAAFMDDALPPGERAELEARIAADPETLMLVRALSEDRARVVRRGWTLAALAAAVLLAVGLSWSGPVGQTEAQALDGRLAEMTAELGRSAPALFAEFALVRAEELASEPSVTRGGAQWIAPLGLLREPPSELRWRNPPGAPRVEVTIKGPGTSWTREVEGEQLPAPDLQPGRYVVTLRGIDTLVAQPIRRVFEILGTDRNAEIARSLAHIHAVAPDDLADLLIAHFAVRSGLFDVARVAALGAQAQGAEIGAAGAALLRHIDSLTSQH